MGRSREHEAASYLEWCRQQEARRRGLTLDEAATQAATEDWGQLSRELAKLDAERAARRARRSTPPAPEVARRRRRLVLAVVLAVAFTIGLLAPWFVTDAQAYPRICQPAYGYTKDCHRIPPHPGRRPIPIPSGPVR